MAATIRNLGIDRLSPEHRLRLIGEIWDRLSIKSIEIPESHREEIDRRLAAADAAPTAGKPWEEMRARLRREKRVIL